MQVGSTLIFSGAPPEYEEFRAQVASRLHLVPRYRQKLAEVPLRQGRPVWIDDPHLNLDYHVREAALPPPGEDPQLRALAGRIFSQRLDRSKPLWELWLVSGHGDQRFAVIGKTHHCLVDGFSGIDIASVLHDTTPDPTRPTRRPDRWIADPEPTGATLLGDALRERATSPAELARTTRAALRTPSRILSSAFGPISALANLLGNSTATPSSPLNVPIGSHRRLAWVDGDLDDLRAIKARHGATVNDVVLAVVAGALGRYLRARGHSTAELELKAMVPISVRQAEELPSLADRVAAAVAPLPIWCQDPIERLEVISRTMGDLKGSDDAHAANLLTELGDFAPPTLAALAARLQSRGRPFNLVVTNAPGPQFPLYLLGRQLETVYPMVPLGENQAFCVGVISYNGRLGFGLTGDYDAMRGIDSLAVDFETTIAETIAASAR